LSKEIHELAKVLAILLVEQGSYSYIDKISQTSSKDLALYHVREALRDYHSLLNRGLKTETTMKLAETINFSELENGILKLKEVEDITQLREKTSLIAALALAEAGRLAIREKRYLATKVLEYLKSKNLFKEDVNALSKTIEEKRKEISEALGISEEDVVEIAKDKNLLQRVRSS